MHSNPAISMIMVILLQLSSLSQTLITDMQLQQQNPAHTKLHKINTKIKQNGLYPMLQWFAEILHYSMEYI